MVLLAQPHCEFRSQASATLLPGSRRQCSAEMLLCGLGRSMCGRWYCQQESYRLLSLSPSSSLAVVQMLNKKCRLVYSYIKVLTCQQDLFLTLLLLLYQVSTKME